MRTSTQWPLPYCHARKTLPLLLALIFSVFSSVLVPSRVQAQSCGPNSFVISGVESGFFDRNNERWTYLIFFVKNNNQNAISHMSFTLPTSGGCAPTYLNTAVTGWARGAYSSTKPTSPITNSLTMVYGKDNSCSVTGQTDVLKISSGANDVDKTTGIWVRLELKGTWEFANDATINFKYGNDCCTQALSTTGGGSGIFGCYWDCALDLKANFTNILCFGGSTTVTVAVTGAAANPAVQLRIDGGAWQTSTSFTGVLAGNHKIEAKQGPCVGEVNFTVGQPSAAVDLTLAPTHVLCFGQNTGSVTATGSGGTGAYQYKIEGGSYSSNNVFGGLVAGTYTVYVKDVNECVKAKSVTINQPGSAVDLTLTPTHVLCYGQNTGSVTATGSGGTGAYQYKIEGGTYSSNNVFGGLVAGTYTVYVKDVNECIKSKSVIINQPGSAVDLTLKPTPVLCFGQSTGSIEATGSGGTGTLQYKIEGGSYSSNNLFTNLAAGTYTVYVKDENNCELAKFATISQPGSAVDLTLKPTHVLCFGQSTGSIEATGSGGTGTLQYKIEGGDYSTENVFTQLFAGTYTVYVKDDNNCIKAASVTIEQPGSAVDLSLTSVDVLCYGQHTGSITATGSGGTGNYLYKLEDGTYSSDNTFEELAAGTYTVYVKDGNGCENAKSITITEPSTAVDLGLSSTNVNCYQQATGSITATGSGGVEPYEYKLNDGTYSSNNVFDNLSAGTYTVYVKDKNNCVKAKSISILQPQSSVSLSLSQFDVLCYGASTGSITATGSGGVDPYEYKIGTGEYGESNIFGGLTAGTYTIYVKDHNGCETFETATLTEPGAPVTLDLKATDVKCYGDKTGSITATGSGGSGEYEYKLNDGSFSSTNVFNNLEAGSYTVTVKDKNNCTTVEQITIGQPASALSLKLTPTDIQCNGAKSGSIKAEGSGGTPAYSYQLEDGGYSTSDEFTNLPPSTYTVYVQDANGCVASDKVTISEPPALDLTLTITDVNCKGYESGIIDAKGSGGTGTLTYRLDNGSFTSNSNFENLVAGTYSVTVKDENGCMLSKGAEIKEPATSVDLTAKADKEKVCTDEKTNVTLTASGGTPPYKYRYDNGQWGDVYVFSLGAGIHQFTVKDANGCEDNTSVTITSQVCGNFCTYTQGYFGNDEGLSSNPGGGGKASYKDGQICTSSAVNKTIRFALASSSLPAKVGNINMSGLTADQIINFLPSGGPSGRYDGFVLPATSIKNSLLAQLVTLALNMGLNPKLADYQMPASGELWTQKAGDCGAGTASSTCTKYSFTSGKGWLVRDIFEAASKALTSSTATNSERSNWSATLDAINRGFDECARSCQAPTIDPSNLLTNLIATEKPRAASTTPTLKVKAYPNPFSDRIFINFTSPVAGKAMVEIFDMSGRRLAEINKGQVNAYTENSIEYLVPSSARSAIIYKVTVGSYSITGRMIAPTR